MTHLRYDYYGAHLAGETRHAQEVMREMGIRWHYSTPQSICDQWWFWSCSHVPETLPSYITPLNVTPQQAIGHGLTPDMADAIAASTKPPEVP